MACHGCGTKPHQSRTEQRLEGYRSAATMAHAAIAPIAAESACRWFSDDMPSNQFTVALAEGLGANVVVVAEAGGPVVVVAASVVVVVAASVVVVVAASVVVVAASVVVVVAASVVVAADVVVAASVVVVEVLAPMSNCFEPRA